MSTDLRRAWMLVTPATLGLLVVLAAPLAGVIIIAFTDWTFGVPDVHFVGLANFQLLASDASFRQALGNSVAYTAMVAPTTVMLGLVVALNIEARESLRGFYRAVHFLPYMSTLAAMAIAWEALLHPTMGLLNQLLGVVGIDAHNWLRDPATVLPTLALIGIWEHFGYAMILFIAGLKTVPAELYEAAALDGADGSFSRFRLITLPALRPVTLFIGVIVAIRSFELFSAVRVLTKGEPAGSSDVILYRLYTESFSYLRLGYGAAITIVFLIVMLGLTTLQFRLRGTGVARR